MKRRPKMKGLSRRDFFRGTMRTGAALSFSSLLPAQTADAHPRAPGDNDICIHVQGPVGPAPLGAPVETSVPFARGQLRQTTNLALYSPEGEPVLAQFRPVLNWPDGSVRWLAVAFEAAAGAGDYFLKEGDGLKSPDLVIETGDRIVIETGELVATISKSGSRLFELLAAPDPSGNAQSVVKGTSGGDLILTRHDGKVFRASLDTSTRRVFIEERGPVRACIRIEGQCRA